MPRSELFIGISYLMAGLLVYLVQTYLIWNTGFFDYDSARNWQIVQEIGEGNFEHLFQHASPTFFLFYAAFTPLFTDFRYYILINCFLNVLAIGLTIRFLAQEFLLSAFSIFLLFLFTGLSGYLVANGRYFTIEAPSLVLFACLLPIHYNRFTKHNNKAFLQALGLLALGLTINYKFLLLIPIAWVLEWWYRDKVVGQKQLILGLMILLAPFVFYGFIALLVKLPYYQLAAVYLKLFYNFQVPTPGSRIGLFNLDVTYYLQYFLRFESPLLLLGLLFFPILFRKQILSFFYKGAFTIHHYLFLTIYLFIAGMHVLQKAPRGLFLIYTPLYAITFICCLSLFRNRIFATGLICASIIYQSFVLQREFYIYANTSYPKVVKYLQAHKIDKIATTVGLGITPFAHTANLEVHSVFDESQLTNLKKQGYRYVLLDHYYLAANIRNFKILEKAQPIVTWQEQSLLPPFLYLDQCEFTGFTYQQALQMQRQVIQDSVQLRLLRIP